MAKCNTAQLESTIVEIGKNRGTPSKMLPGAYRCSGGWAVAQVMVGPRDTAQQETWVFQAEGPFWIPQDRAKVCADPPQVPAVLQNEACNSN